MTRDANAVYLAIDCMPFSWLFLILFRLTFRPVKAFACMAGMPAVA